MVEAGHTKLWLLSLVLVCCVLGSASELTRKNVVDAVSSAAAHATAQQARPSLATAAGSLESAAARSTKVQAAGKAFHASSTTMSSAGAKAEKGASRVSHVAAASAVPVTTSKAAAASADVRGLAEATDNISSQADTPVAVAIIDPSSTHSNELPADLVAVASDPQAALAGSADLSAGVLSTDTEQLLEAFNAEQGGQLEDTQPQQQQQQQEEEKHGFGWMLGRRSAKQQPQQQPGSSSSSSSSSSSNGSGSGSYMGAAFIERRVKPLRATIKSKASIVTRRGRNTKENRHTRADLDNVLRSLTGKKAKSDSDTYSDETLQYAQDSEAQTDSTYEQLNVNELIQALKEKRKGLEKDSGRHAAEHKTHHTHQDSASDSYSSIDSSYPDSDTYKEPETQGDSTHHKKGADGHEKTEHKHVKRVVTHRAGSEHKPKRSSHGSTDINSGRKTRREHTGSSATRSRSAHKSSQSNVQVMEVDSADMEDIKTLLEAIYHSDSNPEFVGLKDSGYYAEVMSALQPHIITDDPETFINSALSEIAAAVANNTTQSTVDEEADGDVEYEEYDVEVEVDDDAEGELDDDVEVVYIDADSEDDTDAEADMEADGTDAEDAKGEASNKDGAAEAKSDLPTSSKAQEKNGSPKADSSADPVAKDNDKAAAGKGQADAKSKQGLGDAKPDSNAEPKAAEGGVDTELPTKTSRRAEDGDDSKAEPLPDKAEVKLETKEGLKQGDYDQKEDEKERGQEDEKENKKEEEHGEEKDAEEEKEDADEELYEKLEEAHQHNKHKKHGKHHVKHAHKSKAHKGVHEGPEDGEGTDDEGFKSVDEMDFEKEPQYGVPAYPAAEDCSDGKCKLNCTASGEYAIANCLICLPDSAEDELNGPVSCNYCKPGFYLESRTKCTRCPKGSWCGGSKATPCPEGYSTEEEGRWTDSQCTLCAAGHGTPDDAPSSPESRLICTECHLGTFSPTDETRPCQHCPANTLSIDLDSGRFGTGGTQCLSCPEGLVPNEDNSDCRCSASHSHCKCPAGWASVADTGVPPCAKCGSNNTYADRKNKAGSTYCKACPKNSVATDGTSCACKPGFWSDDGTAFAPGGCIECNSGSIAAVRGSLKCAKCPYGTAPNAGRTECKPASA